MGEVEATIFNVQRFSTEDGPGIRTTVFFKGCPMRCPWCHNPESIERRPQVVWHGGRCLGDRGCLAACPQEALSAGANGIGIDRERCTGCGRCVAFCPTSALEIHGRTVSVRGVFDLVMRDATFYAASDGGVTLSGGEPLAQAEGALALMRLLHDGGIHTALDTCGVASERALRDAVELAELVLFDVKTVDGARHEAYTGIPFKRVAAAAALVNASSVPVWVRTPVIPGYTGGEADIRRVARFVAETFGHCERHDLLAFSNLCTAKYGQLGRPFALAGTPLLTRETMERLCDAARDEGSPNVHWSGPIRVEEVVA